MNYVRRLHIRVPPGEYDRWQETAKRNGLTLSEWVREVLNAKVGVVHHVTGCQCVRCRMRHERISGSKSGQTEKKEEAQD